MKPRFFQWAYGVPLILRTMREIFSGNYSQFHLKFMQSGEFSCYAQHPDIFDAFFINHTHAHVLSGSA